jgi:hypothetical protein
MACIKWHNIRTVIEHTDPNEQLAGVIAMVGTVGDGMNASFIEIAKAQNLGRIPQRQQPARIADTLQWTSWACA